MPADDNVRRALWDQDQVALVYVKPDNTTPNGEFPANPNGSIDDIAGVCDATGLVLGLMPHPERHVSPLQHPAWTSTATRLGNIAKDGAGLKVFQNAVRHASETVGAGV